MTEATFDTASESRVVDGQPGAKPVENGWGWAFIGLAALGTNNRRSYIVSFLRILLYPHIFLIPVAVLTAWLAFPRHIAPVAMVTIMFGYVIAGGIAAIQSVARTHRRPWLSVLSVRPTLDWRRLAIGAGVQAILILPLFVVMYIFAGQSLRPMPTLSVALIAVLLTPLQAASEEILFRGYLTQALGRIFHSRVVIVAAVGILFAMLHWNTYGALTMPYMFMVSVMLSIVSLRDEGLELTIGAHTAMNWIGIGEIGEMAAGHPAVQITWPYMPVTVVHGVLFYALTRVLVRFFCGDRNAWPRERPRFRHNGAPR